MWEQYIAERHLCWDGGDVSSAHADDAHCRIMIGRWSSATSGTFQKGASSSEIVKKTPGSIGPGTVVDFILLEA